MLQVKNHALLPAIAHIGVNDFIKIARSIYEKMGISVIGNHDGIFVWARLPQGWDIIDKDDEHSILVDDKSIVRGKIVYERNEAGDIKHAIFDELVK